MLLSPPPQLGPYAEKETLLVFTARSELRKVLFLALSVTFYLCLRYPENRKTDLRQIYREDVFGPSLGRV